MRPRETANEGPPAGDDLRLFWPPGKLRPAEITLQVKNVRTKIESGNTSALYAASNECGGHYIFTETEFKDLIRSSFASMFKGQQQHKIEKKRIKEFFLVQEDNRT